VRFETPDLNTGQTLPVNRQTAPPVAANYRESGLVLWLKADLQSPEIDFRSSPNNGHSKAHAGLLLVTPSRHSVRFATPADHVSQIL